MFKEYVSKFQGANERERERDEARPFLLSPSFLRRIFPVGSGNEKQSMP
jgi:hypothetical protein